MGLMVHDKDDTYFIGGHEEDAALKLLKERIDQGFWYYDEDKEQAEKTVEFNRGDDALYFLLSRSDHEYEYVEVKDAQ